MNEAIKPPPGWEELVADSAWLDWAPIGNSEEGLSYEDGVLHVRTRGWEPPECLPLFRRRVEQLGLERR